MKSSPPIPRKSTDPGGFEPSFTPDPQEEITRPDAAVDCETIQLVRLYGELNQVDKRRAIMILTNWAKCPLDRRVLIEALCRELST